jgi:homogentisate 1,2-dioxygenase
LRSARELGTSPSLTPLKIPGANSRQHIQTEFGHLFLQPGEIFVVQRGVRFSIDLADGVTEARGYVTEVWGSMWELPDLGPIGGHGLANPRDFLFPVAAVDEELQVDWKIVNKMNGTYHQIAQDHTPYDLVAWHGNVIPYKVCLFPLLLFLCFFPFMGPSTQPSFSPRSQ